MGEIAHPYALWCQEHGYVGRVAGPSAAYDAARRHETEHGEYRGRCLIWEDGYGDPIGALLGRPEDSDG